ncbi:hypothetical protein B0T26DRAFT_713738 [Lasiosphaeria miniovina]|uniref:Uncharacterized protein n=1 Tax=Lasiosphaeria miniovina TaxID=1954250 RepID=A0AA40AMJ3_9PEZI|nr:uncharacterized protein B0T26DRAFT_713738 [Lasiosphaeria miniovina]KAK0718606.1 hypothetical protein B0T26DRAFT_713738 [Lasiosphaeria miniovina]
MAAYNKFGGEKFRLQSYKNCGRAIRMLQDIVGTEEQATDDKVLASILLLCTLKVRITAAAATTTTTAVT